MLIVRRVVFEECFITCDASANYFRLTALFPFNRQQDTGGNKKKKHTTRPGKIHDGSLDLVNKTTRMIK